MEAVYLDTHVVVWLFEGRLDLLSRTAQQQIESYPVVCSPLMELELQYLYEIRRKKYDATTVMLELGATIGLQVRDISSAVLVGTAKDETWTRDPFDRMIVAQAKADKSVLLSADQTILAHCQLARW